MKWSWFIVAFVTAAMAAGAAAQTVEFRVVERTGRAVVTGPGDAELNLAVQGRVVGGSGLTALAGFSFNIRLVGEPESAGILERGLISNVDHTYTSAIGVSSVVGRGGVASTYTYLAAINPSFNGSINRTSGTFVNGPDQEIGLVTGDALGQSLLGTPGVDADSDGNPDTWVGNGTGGTPTSGTLVALDPAIGSEYFGASGAWIDVYRLRYVIGSFAARTLVFRLERISAATCSGLTFTAGVWGATGDSHPVISASELTISLANSGPGSCCDASGACSIRLGSDCSGVFLPVSSCSPNPCPPPGRCCTLSGPCVMTLQPMCNYAWSVSETCEPNPCQTPKACCSAAGWCTTILPALCSGTSLSTATCAPNPCPPGGACCTGDGGCLFLSQSLCTNGTWMTASSCYSNPCRPGACCTSQTACAQTLQGACVGGVWTVAVSCTPTPCIVGACCSANGGSCTAVLPANCPRGSVFVGVGIACAPDETCAMRACCNLTTRACTLVFVFQGCPTGTSTSGTGSTCSPNMCAGIVCCSSTTGACTLAGPSGGCATGAVVLGPGTSCTPAPCPRLACCNPVTGGCLTIGPSGACPANTVLQGGATCTITLCPRVPCCDDVDGYCWLIGPAGTCPTGSTRGSGSTCSATSCPPLGRCCDLMGACNVFTQIGCLGVWTAGSSCVTNVCPQPGRCCTLAGACNVTLASACGDIWSASGSCLPNVCGQYGACCHEGTCSIQLQSNCLWTENTGHFRGTGIACSTPNNPIGCCLANFNLVNGVNVQDLMDFFSAWFAHDSQSDFDRDGSITLTDVTKFVAAWMAGCP